MASVDWQKATTQKAGAMKKHNGKEERVNGNHSNTDIDKSKSHLNVYIGADDYAPMFEKVKARIKEVDKEHPPLRNMRDRRITCILLETPVPQEITEQGKAEEFLRKAHKIFEDFFGVENVGGTVGHFDEQHYYIDKDGKERLSLIHGHSVVAAYAEWIDKAGESRKGINGKHCETRARLKALNKAMDEMCRREYGISYNTAESPERKSVETLKQESEVRQELGELRKKALAYDLTSPKKLTESKGAYEERKKVHQKGIALDEKEKAFEERVLNYDTELNNKAVELAKQLTVKRLESERDKARAGEQKAVQAHREALARVQELERQNADLAKQRQNVIKENDVLLGMVEDMHEELTGECIEGEELLKRKLKSQKPKSKQIGR